MSVLRRFVPQAAWVAAAALSDWIRQLLDSY